MDSFCDGESRAKTLFFSARSPSSVLAQPDEPVAGDDFRNIEADVLADLAGDKRVVAGQYFGGHAELLERGDRLGRRTLGRIEEGDVAEQDQVALVGHGEGLLGLRKLPVGDAQDAVAVAAQLLIFLEQVVLDQVDHQVDLVIHLVLGADLVDILDRALADEHVVALVIDHHRHALALEVEGDFIHLAGSRARRRTRCARAPSGPAGCAARSGSNCSCRRSAARPRCPGW